jgi:hypothetical protein
MKLLQMKTNSKAPDLSDLPDWVRATELLVDLQTKFLDAEASVQRLMAEFTVAGAGSSTNSATVERARALLNDAAQGAGASKLPRNSTEIQHDLASARENRAIYAEAVALQRGVVEEPHYKLSAEIFLSLKSEHRRLVGLVAEKARELAEASAAEEEFRDDLKERGIAYQSGGLKPMLFPRLGKLSEHGSMISRYLREVSDY